MELFAGSILKNPAIRYLNAVLASYWLIVNSFPMPLVCSTVVNYLDAFLDLYIFGC